MPGLITSIQDAMPVPEVDARTVLRSAPEPIISEPEPTAQEVLEPFDAVLTVRAVRSYAQLLVERVDDEHFKLSGHHADNIMLEPGEARGRPRLSLGELASSRRVGGAGLEPEDLYRLMLVWSQEEQELIDWLQRLRAAVGDEELRLVIWDTTGFDIPWELFHVPAGGPPSDSEGPLGALMTVARRVTVHQAITQGTPYTHHACRGRLLAYVEDEMVADRNFLPGYHAGAVNGTDELLDQLDKAQGSLGLVYVACHGDFAGELSGLRLGGIQYYDVALYPLAALSRSRPVVFLNACHAGRLLRDPRINKGVYGFARAFLQGGADVVIGPTGFIETELARQVAAAIIDQVTRQPSQPLAVALTQVRAMVAQRVIGKRKPPEADLKAFIYTFMYVCYGNPYATLELTAGGDG